MDGLHKKTNSKKYVLGSLAIVALSLMFNNQANGVPNCFYSFGSLSKNQSNTDTLIINSKNIANLNALLTNNTTVIFPGHSKYYLDKTLEISAKKNITILLGNGVQIVPGINFKDAPLIKIWGGAKYIKIGGDGTIDLAASAPIAIQIQDSCKDVTVNGITFKGPNIVGPNYDIIKVLGYDSITNSKLYVSNISIKNCKFYNSTGNAISFRNVMNSKIQGNVIKNIYATNKGNTLVSGSGIAEMFSNDIDIDDNDISNCELHGIYAGLGSNNEISDNSIRSVKGGGIRLDTERKFIIRSNNIYSAGTGVICEVSENGIISNNVIDSTSHYGIHLQARESKKKIVDLGSYADLLHPNDVKLSRDKNYSNDQDILVNVSGTPKNDIIFYYNFPSEQDWTTKSNAQSEIEFGFEALGASIPSNSLWLVLSAYKDLKNPSTVIPFPYIRKEKKYALLNFSKDNWYTDYSKVRSIGIIRSKSLGKCSFVMSSISTDIPHNDGVIISNNQILKSGYYGISFDSFNDHVVCHDNVIFDSGYFAPTSIGGYGIWITNGNKDLLIHDNYIKTSFAAGYSRDMAVSTDKNTKSNSRLMVYNNYYNDILNESHVDDNISNGIKKFSYGNTKSDTLIIKGLKATDHMIVGWMDGQNMNIGLSSIVMKDTLIVKSNQTVRGKPVWWYKWVQ